jgi:hypothetical protein
MRLRVRRRNLVVWRGSAGLAGGYGATVLTRVAPTGRIRRRLRIGALLTVIGLMRLARGIRARWKPLLAGGVLTAVGLMLSSSMWSLVSVFGLWLLVYALLVPGNPDGSGRRRADLERELAAYSTPAQRRDLEAILDRYPDGATYELRDILARQAMAAGHNGVPGAGRC